MEHLKQPISILSVILRVGEILKIDLRYILKGGSWLVLGQILAALISLLLSIAFARFVPKEVYGEYKYILSLATVLGVFSLNGMALAVTRSTSAGFDGTILVAIRSALKYNAILFPIASIIALYYFWQGNDGLGTAFLVFGVTSPLISSFSLYDGYLLGKKDFRSSVIASTTISFVCALGVMGVMFFDPTPLLLVTTYLTLTVMGTLFFYHRTIKHFSPDQNKVDPMATTYGTHLSIMSFFNIIADQLDKVLIFHYLGAAQLAIYSFAIAIPEQIKGMLKNITVLMLPRFSERTDKELIQTLWRKMFLYGLLVGGIVLLYLISAPTIFKILFPAYGESVYYSQLVALSLITIIINVPYAAIQTRMKKGLLYGFNISSAIIQIILFLVLTPLYGILGAILSIIGSRLYSFVFWICVTILLSIKKGDSI